MDSLDKKKQYEFNPESSLKIGQILTGGDFAGCVFENSLFEKHHILIPPLEKGRLTYIAEPGYYTLNDKILELEYHD